MDVKAAEKVPAAGESHVLRGIVFAALGGICWGFSGNCAQMLTAELGVPVMWITAVRLTVAAVIFLAICWRLCATGAAWPTSPGSLFWACCSRR